MNPFMPENDFGVDLHLFFHQTNAIVPTAMATNAIFTHANSSSR